MTLLSLFMTSTGIFCFVPISQRLVESGIIPASHSWQLRSMPSVLAPAWDARNEEKTQFPLAHDEAENAWSEAEDRYQALSSPTQIPLYSIDDQHLMKSCANEWSAGIVSPLECSAVNSLSQSSSIDTFYGREYTSFISDSTLCDSCNTLLRREIPPDHIPSVIRALALFEAQDQLYDVVLNECEIAALTDAFSMLQL